MTALSYDIFGFDLEEFFQGQIRKFIISEFSHILLKVFKLELIYLVGRKTS